MVIISYLATGEMVEWSITAVLKTAVPRGTGGSNPSLSANKGVNQQVMRFTPFIVSPKVSWYFLYGLLRHDVRDSFLRIFQSY